MADVGAASLPRRARMPRLGEARLRTASVRCSWSTGTTAGARPSTRRPVPYGSSRAPTAASPSDANASSRAQPSVPVAARAGTKLSDLAGPGECLAAANLADACPIGLTASSIGAPVVLGSTTDRARRRGGQPGARWAIIAEGSAPSSASGCASSRATATGSLTSARAYLRCRHCFLW